MVDENEQERRPDDADAGPSQPSDEKPADAKDTASPTASPTAIAAVIDTVKALDRQDKMVLLGSLALVVLFLLPWYAMSTSVLGVKQSSSINGLHGAAWIGWIAAIAATILSLAKAGILGSMPPAVVSASKSTGSFAVLTGLALLMGPLYFWSRVSGNVPDGIGQIAEFSVGKTFFFYLALLAALTAAAGAAWRLTKERQAGA